MQAFIPERRTPEEVKGSVARKEPAIRSNYCLNFVLKSLPAARYTESQPYYACNPRLKLIKPIQMKLFKLREWLEIEIIAICKGTAAAAIIMSAARDQHLQLLLSISFPSSHSGPTATNSASSGSMFPSGPGV